MSYYLHRDQQGLIQRFENCFESEDIPYSLELDSGLIVAFLVFVYI